MSVHYVIRSGSEADKRVADYWKRMKKSKSKCDKIAKELGVLAGDYLRTSEGKLCGFKIQELPENWKTCKDYYSYGFPKRMKVNKEILSRCDEVEFPSAVGVCKALFGASSFYFEGLSVARGIGFEEVQGRKVITASNDEQIQDAVNRDGGSYPKGLRKVKGSTVEKWREQEAA